MVWIRFGKSLSVWLRNMVRVRFRFMVRFRVRVRFLGWENFL